MNRLTASAFLLALLSGTHTFAEKPPVRLSASGPPTRVPISRPALPPGENNTPKSPSGPTVKQPGLRPIAPTPNVGKAGDPNDPRFALTLTDGTKLIGEPVGLALVPVATSFGTAKIPLNVVRNINVVPNANTVKVYFRNGDIVSGTLQAETVSFQTPYGLVRVPVKDIVRLQHGSTFSAPGRRQIVNHTNVRPTPGNVSGSFTDPFGGSGLPPGGYIPVRPDMFPSVEPAGTRKR